MTTARQRLRRTARYSAHIYPSISDAKDAGWCEVHEKAGDVFSTPHFVDMVERTLGSYAPCSPVVVLDESHCPVAITVISSFHIDATILAPDWHQTMADRIRTVWPEYLYFGIVFCGLPTLFSPRTIWIAEGASMEQVLLALVPLLEETALSKGARLISFGDIDDDESESYGMLQTRGFRRLPALPANRMRLTHSDLQGYISELRQAYRHSLRQDQRGLEATGWTVHHHFDDPLLASLITDDLYAHYLDLMGRTPLRTITLPKLFFQELARACASNLHLVRLMDGDRCMGFLVGMIGAETYYPLFIAVDETRKKEYALYRALSFEAMRFAMKRGISFMEWGGTSDRFKNRVGCHQIPRSVYVKVRGALGLGFRAVSPLFADREPLMKPARIYKGPRVTPCPSRRCKAH